MTRDFPAERIRFGMHYADPVRRDETGATIADLSRLGVLEPNIVNR